MLTIDAWKTKNNTRLQGVSAHWVDAKWQYNEQVLDIRELNEKHDGNTMDKIIM